MKQLLAVDIGNTSVHFAFFKGARKISSFRSATHLFVHTISPAFLKKIRRAPDIDVVIGSVVPQVTKKLVPFFKKNVHGKVIVAGVDHPVPIVNHYRHPKQVGVDRLLNALAAYRQYRRALIIIDFGTAITFDVVSSKGGYLGGVIAPGIEISLDALFSRTALLPKTKLRHPGTRVGRDTMESIRIGCSYGIGGLCERIVREISKELKVQPKILATGGYADFMKRYCPSIQKIHPDLTMEGLRLTFLSTPPQT